MRIGKMCHGFSLSEMFMLGSYGFCCSACWDGYLKILGREKGCQGPRVEGSGEWGAGGGVGDVLRG